MKTRTKTRTIPKTPFFAAFSVGAVLFSAHAGGGFATGNQANTYYVGLGWAGIVSAIVAMLLLTLTMREAMIMYNSRGLTSYKQLFETLYHPFDKIEWLFEIFFYIMVLMAVAAAISGAASALRSYFGVNYYLGVVAVGCLVLLLTIFGAGIVRAASTYMGIAILVTAITIYAIGIFKSESPLFTVLSADFRTTGSANVPKAIFNAFTYAGFQSAPGRSAIVSAFIIILSMSISMAGLTNNIKYGYGYCGYLGIAVVVVPFLTVGVYKNRKYIREHGLAQGFAAAQPEAEAAEEVASAAIPAEAK